MKCGANELVLAFCGALAVDVGAALDGGGSCCVSEARAAGVLFGWVWSSLWVFVPVGCEVGCGSLMLMALLVVFVLPDWVSRSCLRRAFDGIFRWRLMDLSGCVDDDSKALPLGLLLSHLALDSLLLLVSPIFRRRSSMIASDSGLFLFIPIGAVNVRPTWDPCRIFSTSRMRPKDDVMIECRVMISYFVRTPWMWVACSP